MAKKSPNPLCLEALENRWNLSTLDPLGLAAPAPAPETPDGKQLVVTIKDGPITSYQTGDIPNYPTDSSPVSAEGFTGGVYVGGARFTNNQDDQGIIVAAGTAADIYFMTDYTNVSGGESATAGDVITYTHTVNNTSPADGQPQYYIGYVKVSGEG